MKIVSKLYIGIIYFLLYAPIVVIAVFSFNAGDSTSVMEGVSLRWYSALFEKPELFEALKNSLLLALSSGLLATVIGTMAAVGLARMQKKWMKSSVNAITKIPMMNPEIVTGISMMLLFVFISKNILGNVEVNLGFFTLLIAHVTFNLPYVILSVMPKLRQMDKFLPEAAQDLGCPPWKSFFLVELPNILPGVISGFIMAFTLSLDDFVISLFNGGDNFKTLPVLIYNYTKKPVKPDIYALFTLIVITILLLLVLSNLASNRDERRKARAKK
ncbi:MAG: ABC transporter permease [Clostridia bacterium]|nr:ABC transporter permease [Clostridia bacterium]